MTQVICNNLSNNLSNIKIINVLNTLSVFVYIFCTELLRSVLLFQSQVYVYNIPSTIIMFHYYHTLP